MYAYVRNNPTTLTDPTGLWSPEDHEKIIDAVFAGILNTDERDMLKGVSEMVDEDQSPGGAYKHGMSEPGEDPAVAAIKTADFINQNLNTAVQIQLSGDNNGYAGRNSPDALYYFGQALHAATDRVSPEHEGEQVWRGLVSIGALVHGAAEYVAPNMRPGNLEEAKYEARALWARYQAMLALARLKKSPETNKPCTNQTCPGK